MDLKEYFGAIRTEAARLEKSDHDRKGFIHVTSIFHRERNSTAGRTYSATYLNAARVITDNTHREATRAEVDGFFAHQDQELRKNMAMEQKNKKQYIVVVDEKDRAVQAGTSAAVGASGDNAEILALRAKIAELESKLPWPPESGTRPQGSGKAGEGKQ
jgi:hypothetical protein